MRAVIVSIGDELTSGLTVNTNAAWIGRKLLGMGIDVAAHVTVGDEAGVIEKTIREASANAEVVIVSGGLGPTEDDVTREGLAAAMGEALVMDEAALGRLKGWFARIGRPMVGSNERQAMRPKSAVSLENTAGTAPGMMAVVGGARVFVVPGVPKEMREMVERAVLPALAAGRGDLVTVVRKINTFGAGESAVGEKIADLMKRGAVPSVGTTVHDGIVSVRVYASGVRAEAEEMARRVGDEVRGRLGEIVFGEGEETIEDSLGRMLVEKKMTVATAESCTGGMMAEMLTNVSGSSAYVMRAWVTYANAAKVEELGVEAEVIAKVGAVSEEVARAMAEGARRQARTDWAISTTGVAGPGGGSAEKPVGTVWISLAGESGTEARRFIFPGDRGAVRLRAAQMGLMMLRWKVMGVGAPI